MPVRTMLAEIARDDLFDLLVGGQCVGCERPGRSWCPACALELARPARAVRPDPAPPGLPEAWAGATYDGAVRAAILAYKERGRVGLARPLGRALGTALSAALDASDSRAGPPATEPDRMVGVPDRWAPDHGVPDRWAPEPGAPEPGAPEPGAPEPGQPGRPEPRAPVLVVPVPSTRAAIRTRGHDPLRRLCRVAVALGRRRGHAIRAIRPAPVLRQRRAVVDQSGLDAAARWANLAGAFEVAPGSRRMLPGRSAIVVDDVLTTGATAAEAVRALTAAGVVVHAVAIVAATVRRAGAGPGNPRS